MTTQLVAERGRRRGARATGVFPLGLGGQRKGPACWHGPVLGGERRRSSTEGFGVRVVHPIHWELVAEPELRAWPPARESAHDGGPQALGQFELRRPETSAQ